MIESIPLRPGQILPEDHQKFWDEFSFHLFPCFYAEYSGPKGHRSKIFWILTDDPVTEDENGFPDWVEIRNELEVHRDLLSRFF